MYQTLSQQFEELWTCGAASMVHLFWPEIIEGQIFPHTFTSCSYILVLKVMTKVQLSIVKGDVKHIS
jgi:hypothetical protein